MKDKPNKVKTALKVVIAGEFYDDDATEETLRYAVEQDLEDAGFDVDVALLKEQETKEVKESTNMYTGLPITHCPKCGVSLDRYLYGRQHEGQINYCPYCGQAVKWNDD